MQGLLVLDYGSQYTLLIARRLRENKIYSEIVDTQNPKINFDVRGVILSGGPDSVNAENARPLPQWVFDLKVPILGVCYGMQLLVQYFGGSVKSGEKREFGRALVDEGKGIFQTFSGKNVWMSHGDHVENLGENFLEGLISNSGVTAGIFHKSKKIYGLQFHPEVEHTENGTLFLERFAREICEISVAWATDQHLEAARKMLLADVGLKGNVLVACSGGVDSTVLAALVGTTLPNVTTVFCDTGLLRKDEVAQVSDTLKKIGLRNVVVLSAKENFFRKLVGVSDPEQKRKIIGAGFIEEFENFARGKSFTHLAQGTLYPDVIESAGGGSGAKLIKTHHNVGGLPEKLALKLCEPFRLLFKDDVRAIGRALGLPEAIVGRHPFPGPGLGVRIIGEITEDKVELLQKADHVFITALKDKGFYDKVWQAFAVLLPVRTVGVMGDNRTYQFTCALRAVTSSDGMTADVGHLPMEFLTMVAGKIVREVPGINRVVYDITSKPPATIEWE